MGLFSKTVDYNLKLEEVLDKKRFSANTKSLLLSMLYKIETAYPDYAKVKHLSKNKDAFLLDLIGIVDEYFDRVKTAEPGTKEANSLKKYKVLAVTNEAERTILTYPTETALLYAIADVEPKYFYIEDFIFKNEFQQMLVEGSNLNILEILDDFTGWSWDPKSSADKKFVSNLIYQNLISIFGTDFINKCKKSKSKEYDIAAVLKKKYKNYYYNLIEVIYLNNKSPRFEKKLEKRYEDLKQFSDSSNYIEKIEIKKSNIIKKLEKIDSLLKDEKLLKKSFNTKNSKLDNQNKMKSLNQYIQLLRKERKANLVELDDLREKSDLNNISKNDEEYKIISGLLESDNTLEEAIINLQLEFIKILYRNSRRITGRAEFIDFIYKVRYYKNIYISKDKCIKDYEELEKLINKVLKEIITFGTKNVYVRMISLNINLNAKILIKCLDTKSMELENLSFNITEEGKNIIVEVFDNKIFDKKFHITHNLSNSEILVKKKKNLKIFI